MMFNFDDTKWTDIGFFFCYTPASQSPGERIRAVVFPVGSHYKNSWLIQIGRRRINHYLEFIFIIFFSLVSLFHLSAQSTATISGYVTDAATGERLAGATVYLPEHERGAACNDYGFFSLGVPAGKVNFVFRFVGYEPWQKTFTIKNDTLLNVRLESRNIVKEVEVVAISKEDFLHSPAMGTHRLNAQQIEQIPAVLGEPDLLKAIQLLPGVSFATEGSTGFSVRGGSPDQTLIRLDGVPVYNVNHLWGFMSAFNNDAIQDTRLYKGNLPARYGGRLSSVLDVSMKEGNLHKQTGTFSLSPIAGRFTLEGPVVKEKVSFMVSARRTWIDALVLAALKLEGQEDEQVLTYGFWDINAKTNWVVNPRNRIYLSFYTGYDAFNVEDSEDRYEDYAKFSYNWQNLTTVLRWNHIFSPLLFANFSAYNSRFRQLYLNEFDKKGNEVYKGYNNLNDMTTKGDFDWFPVTNKTFRFGYEFSLQQFNPEIISYRSDSTFFKLNSDVFTRNFISEIYAEVESDITERTKGTIGIRAGNLATGGRNYLSLRPRASVRYLFAEQLSGKVSWSRMKQFLHQLQNTTLGIPTELWVSSTKNIKPGTSDLFSSGLFWNNKNYKFSIEAFYTDMKDVVQYKEGTLAVKERGDSWEEHVEQGRGKSYGLELMSEKTTGSLTGWIAYTLSKSSRQFSQINFGRPFPYTYDRRHQLNINTNWNLSVKQKKDKIITKDISATFSYASGRYITLAEQEYQAIPLPLMEGSRYNAEWFAQRSLINSVNNYHMPEFHNLNLSYRVERETKGKINCWNFSVYNVYNRLNPWYYYKKGDQMKQITLFPLIPSVSFSYKW